MKRAWLLTVLLVATAARAHLVNFDFVAPSGAGNVDDGGVYVIQWLDSLDSTGMTTVELFASRTGLGPFATGLDASVEATDASIAINDPLDLYVWKTGALEPGCYQPFAVVHDPIEGTSARPAAGVITIAPTDGGNIPPSLWFVTVPAAQPNDAGNLALEVDYQDPEDPGQLELDWYGSDHDGGLLAQHLPLPAGGGHISYTLSTALLPRPGSYFVKAIATSNDGRDCQVWWGGSIFVPGDAGGPDEGDSGVDAGPPEDDGGMPDGGFIRVGHQVHCGCGSGGPLGAIATLLLLLSRRRKR